jgi:hypothetical protein
VIVEAGCGTAPYARLMGLMGVRNVLSLDADLEVEAKKRLETLVLQDKDAIEKKGKLDVSELHAHHRGCPFYT